MRYLAVDDENMALEMLCDAIREADPGCDLFAFTDPVRALEEAKRCEFDAAFLDVQMNGMDGVTMARELKARTPRINIIFATAFQDYMFNAFDMNASDYLLKPITAAKVRKALDNLRYPPEQMPQTGVFFRCFGNFEVLNGGAPVRFRYEKAKEMLAYLFDRQGSMCTTNELYDALWENEGHVSYYKQVRRDLLVTLEEQGLSELIVNRRGCMGLNMAMIQSDFFDWKAGKPSGLNAYRGEYMAQYSWAEFTNGMLFNRVVE